MLPVDSPLTTMLKADPGWRVVADDHRAVLLVRLSRQRLAN